MDDIYYSISGQSNKFPQSFEFMLISTESLFLTRRKVGDSGTRIIMARKGKGRRAATVASCIRSYGMNDIQPHLRPVEPRPTDETDENAKISQSGGEKAKPPSDLRSKAFCKIDWQGEGHGANAEACKGSAEADGKHAGGLRDQEAREAEWQGSGDDCHLGRSKRLGCGWKPFCPGGGGRVLQRGHQRGRPGASGSRSMRPQSLTLQA